MLDGADGRPAARRARARRERSRRTRSREEAKAIYVEESLNRYVVALLPCDARRLRLYLGASPRAGSRCCESRRRVRSPTRAGSSARRRESGRRAVLSHRLILAPEARSTGLDGEQICGKRSRRPRFPSRWL